MKFDTYLNYKKIETVWLNEIPSEWSMDRIKNLGTVRGRVGWKALKASEYVDKSEYIFIATPNIKYKDIDFKNVNYLTKERYYESPEIMLKEDDVVLTKDGSTLGTVNIIKYLPSYTTVNSSIAVLRFKSVNSKFMYYQIKSEYIQNIVKLKKDGAGVPHLFQKDINDFHMLLPDIEVQDKLATYLDMKITELDKEISLLEQKIKKYQELKQTLINESVLRGLNKDVELKDSDTQWIGDIPKHWNVKRLKDFIIYTIGGAVIDVSYWGEGNELTYTAGKHPVMSNFDNFPDRKRTKANDILIARNGDGFIHIPKLNSIFTNVVQLVRLNKKVDVRFIRYSLENIKFHINKTSNGDFIASLNKEMWFNSFIMLPSLKEQVQIANYLDEKTTKIDKIVKTIGTKIEVLKGFKKTLINDVVTGKVKVA